MSPRKRGDFTTGRGRSGPDVTDTSRCHRNPKHRSHDSDTFWRTPSRRGWWPDPRTGPACKAPGPCAPASPWRAPGTTVRPCTPRVGVVRSRDWTTWAKQSSSACHRSPAGRSSPSSTSASGYAPSWGTSSESTGGEGGAMAGRCPAREPLAAESHTIDPRIQAGRRLPGSTLQAPMAGLVSRRRTRRSLTPSESPRTGSDPAWSMPAFPPVASHPDFPTSRTRLLDDAPAMPPSPGTPDSLPSADRDPPSIAQGGVHCPLG